MGQLADRVPHEKGGADVSLRSAQSFGLRVEMNELRQEFDCAFIFGAAVEQVGPQMRFRMEE